MHDSFDDARDIAFNIYQAEEAEKYEGDDSNFSFRVNKNLKTEFAKLCKNERLSSAAILKRYMTQCVKKGEITF